MLHKNIHIFDIHLSISIKSDESFYLELVAVLLDEVISGLICGTASSIDRMTEDDDECVRMMFLLFLEYLQGIVARPVIDKDYFPESCMNDLLDDFADLLFLVIDPDIEDKLIFFIGIVSMSDLVFVLVISCIHSVLRNESGQLEFIFGMFIEHVDIEIE